MVLDVGITSASPLYNAVVHLKGGQRIILCKRVTSIKDIGSGVVFIKADNPVLVPLDNIESICPEGL